MKNNFNIENNQNYNNFHNNQGNEYKKLNHNNFDNKNNLNNSNYNAIEEQNNSNYEDEYAPDSFQKDLRRAFIQKVFAILSLQLLITIAFCALSANIPEIAKFQKQNKTLLQITIVIGLGIMLCLFCFQQFAKQVPVNYILLLTFTSCQTYLVAYLCVTTNARTVFMALTLTIAIVIGLILYAFYTKTDFTGYGHYLFICSLIMLVCGIFLCFTQNKVLHVVFSGLGVLLFSIYLIYDVQLIIGNRSNKLDYDDYILGALMLYVDVINIFENLFNLMR